MLQCFNILLLTYTAQPDFQNINVQFKKFPYVLENYFLVQITLNLFVSKLSKIINTVSKVCWNDRMFNIEWTEGQAP